MERYFLTTKKQQYYIIDTFKNEDDDFKSVYSIIHKNQLYKTISCNDEYCDDLNYRPSFREKFFVKKHYYLGVIVNKSNNLEELENLKNKLLEEKSL